MGVLKEIIDAGFGVYDRAKEIPKTIKPGKYCWFGAYEWLVLDVRGGRALLIAKDIIDVKRYNNEWKETTWEQCALREYLNGEFYNSESFSEEDRKKIVKTSLANPKNPEYATDGGKTTQDYIFCLSIDEVKKYFKSDNDRKATYNGTAAWWWLRSPGSTQGRAAGATVAALWTSVVTVSTLRLAVYALLCGSICDLLSHREAMSISSARRRNLAAGGGREIKGLD